jgi:protein gp37
MMSAISWTDEAFAPWFGCTKVSPACDHCYAENWALHYRKAEWGPRAERIRSAASTWKNPFAWDRKASRLGRQLFVFCSELSDVFDNKAPDEWREDLWSMIRQTPNLVWLILTKRPQLARRMLPADWGEGYANVWLGTTAENQVEADRRLPVLCELPATRRFVSAEPLLGPVDFRPWLGPITWIIAGCESNQRRPGKRPTDVDWIRSLRDQCSDAGISFWLKQLVVDDKLVELPELDGRTWEQRPSPRGDIGPVGVQLRIATPGGCRKVPSEPVWDRAGSFLC